jgi:hypothetical protein
VPPLKGGTFCFRAGFCCIAPIRKRPQDPES